MSAGLEKKRKITRDSLTRTKFDDAGRELEEILAIVDDNDAYSSEDEQDEWRIWAKMAQESAKEKFNKWKRGI